MPTVTPQHGVEMSDDEFGATFSPFRMDSRSSALRSSPFFAGDESPEFRRQRLLRTRQERHFTAADILESDGPENSWLAESLLSSQGRDSSRDASSLSLSSGTLQSKIRRKRKLGYCFDASVVRRLYPCEESKILSRPQSFIASRPFRFRISKEGGCTLSKVMPGGKERPMQLIEGRRLTANLRASDTLIDYEALSEISPSDIETCYQEILRRRMSSVSDTDATLVWDAPGQAPRKAARMAAPLKRTVHGRASASLISTSGVRAKVTEAERSHILQKAQAPRRIQDKTPPKPPKGSKKKDTPSPALRPVR